MDDDWDDENWGTCPYCEFQLILLGSEILYDRLICLNPQCACTFEESNEEH